MKKKVLLLISIALVSLVVMTVALILRSNYPILAAVETDIEQATPTHGNYTEEYPTVIKINRTASGWIDLGRISIPPEWTYTITDFGPSDIIRIFGESASGLIHMAVWYLMVGDPYMVVNEFSTRQAFSFDDGRSGYMLKNPLSGSAQTLVLWLQHDSWIALSLYYDGDDSVFTENEELILKIARTLTS